jgi:hypothetical protein
LIFFGSSKVDSDFVGQFDWLNRPRKIEESTVKKKKKKTEEFVSLFDWLNFKYFF